MKLVPLFEGELVYDESTEIGFPLTLMTATGSPTFRATAQSAASACRASFAGRTTLADARTEPGCRTTKARSQPPTAPNSSSRWPDTTRASVIHSPTTGAPRSAA